MILFFAFLGGLVVAWLLGAQLGRMDELKLRGAGFIFSALALELALFIPGVDVVPAGLTRPANIVSYALVSGFMLTNLRRPGFALAALGAFSNSLAIIANRGLMPVSAAAWTDSGRFLSEFSKDHTFANNVLASHSTHLQFLGDMFAIPRAIPLATPISIGDVFIVLGAVIFIYRACTPPLAHTGVHPLQPLRNAAFRHLILARVTSSAGDWITMTAVVTWLYTEYHSTLVITIFMIARIAAATLGGLIAARGFLWLARYRILTIVEASRGGITALAIPCAIWHQPALVILLASTSSLIGAATRPGATSLIPSILPVEALQAGNAIHGVARNITMVAATFGAAFTLIRFGVATALILDVCTFAAAAIAYQTYANSETRLEAPPDEDLLSLRQQLRWISRNRICGTLVASFAVATAAIGVFNTALPAFMTSHAHQARGYGLALGFIGIGFTVGEASTAFIHRESVARRSIGLAFIGSGAALWTLSHTVTIPTAFMALVMLGSFDGTTEVVFDTLVQRSAPAALQASVFALASSIQNAGMVTGFLAAPIIVASGHTSGAITIAAAGSIAAAGVAAMGLHPKRAQLSEHDSLHHTLDDQLIATTATHPN